MLKVFEKVLNKRSLFVLIGFDYEHHEHVLVKINPANTESEINEHVLNALVNHFDFDVVTNFKIEELSLNETVNYRVQVGGHKTLGQFKLIQGYI